MADANSNEATVQALMSARRIIDTCINTVREWERDNNGGITRQVPEQQSWQLLRA